MKRIIQATALLALLLPLTKKCVAQQAIKTFAYNQFEKQIRQYTPIKTVNVTQKDFDFAVMNLKGILYREDSSAEPFITADYFNILSALLSLKESKENILVAFQKFIDSESGCEYIQAMANQIEKTPKYDPIRK